MHAWPSASRLFRTLLIALLAIAVTGAPDAAAEPPASAPVVAVGVYDYAGVPPDEMERALGYVTAWFAAAGTVLEWVDRRDCDSALHWPVARRCTLLVDLALIIPNATTADTLAPSPDVIGLAPSSPDKRGRIAYAFYHRMAGVPPERLARWMAVVTAHELGHLLLPHGAHATEGLMRGEWQAAEVWRLEIEGLGFTLHQAQLIRQRLGAD
jgi:hypothetical protein